MQGCQTLFNTEVSVLTSLVDFKRKLNRDYFQRNSMIIQMTFSGHVQQFFKDCYDKYSQSMWNADKTNESVFFNFSKIYDYSSGVCGIGIEHVN